MYIYIYISRWFGRHIFGILWGHDQTCRTATFYRGIGVVNDVSTWIGRWLVNVCPGKQVCSIASIKTLYLLFMYAWLVLMFDQFHHPGVHWTDQLWTPEFVSESYAKQWTITYSNIIHGEVVWHHKAKHSRHLPRLDLFTLKGIKQGRKGSVNM